VNDIVVLKLGSSVLRSGADLLKVVSEIYRHVRLATRVAVVSAFPGHRPISFDARRWIAQPNVSALARLATGRWSRDAARVCAGAQRLPVSFVDP